MPELDGRLREAIRGLHRESGRSDPACEGPPAFLDHPLVDGAKPSRAEIRSIYTKLFGTEPPETIEEWKAQTMATLGHIPNYAQRMIDKWESTRDI